jgi:hypothetical protein
MKTMIQLIGYISIIVLIVPSILYLGGRMELDQVKTIMIAATIVWFGSSIILVWNLDKKLIVKSQDMS